MKPRPPILGSVLDKIPEALTILRKENADITSSDSRGPEGVGVTGLGAFLSRSPVLLFNACVLLCLMKMSRVP